MRPRSNTKSDADKSGDEVGSVQSIKLYDAACLSFLFGWRAVVVVDGGEWEGRGGWRRCEGLENRWNECMNGEVGAMYC